MSLCGAWCPYQIPVVPTLDWGILIVEVQNVGLVDWIGSDMAYCGLSSGETEDTP